MSEFGRRFRAAMSTFLTDWVGPGMIGFAPMLLPLQEFPTLENLWEQALLRDPPVPEPDRPLRMAGARDQS